MHCEGCAGKVSNCLKGFDGIEEVKTDVKSNRVIVKGRDKMLIHSRFWKELRRNIVEMLSLFFPNQNLKPMISRSYKRNKSLKLNKLFLKCTCTVKVV
ncbi:hypothetical protein REPUB_Repub04eG0205500 [Reevesia pubescens]